MSARGEAGFTLVEVLVALAVLGLIMAALAGGLGFSLKAAGTGERLGEETVAMARLDGLLRRQLQGALRLRGEGRPRAALSFAGQAARLSFPIAAPAYPTEAGLYRVDFAVVAESGGESLLYSRSPYDGGAAAADADDRARALLSAVRADIRFAYYDGKAWRDSWAEADALPRLVRLRIAAPESGRPLWPDIIVRPAAEADPECPDPSRAAACAGPR